MAFDFVSYIVQQVEQQHPNLFAEEGKNQKLSYITHLVALQLAQCINLQSTEPDQLYHLIQTQDEQWLAQTASQKVTEEPYFQAIQPKLRDANNKIANTLISELYQLDQNAHLGQAGIQELIDGQYQWMQDQVQDWFWDVIGQPQFKRSEPASDEPAEFQQVMKEFSQMIQQQAQHHAEDLHVQPVDIQQVIPVNRLYLILNPLIAIIILIGLYHAIF